MERWPSYNFVTYLTTVKAAVQSYRCYANLVNLQMKRDAASRLNKKGKNYQVYKVGDHVSYYKPISAMQLQALNRKPKHTLFWSGPARITKIEGNMITIQDTNSNGVYVRARQLIRPFRAVRNGPLNDLGSSIPISKGQILALRDDDAEDTTEYWLASVLSIHQDQIRVQYWYTTKRNLEQARFTRAYHSVTHPEKMFMVAETAVKKGAKPWIGQLSRECLDATLVASDITIDRNGKLSRESYRKLSKVRHLYQHGVLEKTELSRT